MNQKKFTCFDAIVYSIITIISLCMLFPFINVIAVSMSDYSAYLKNPLMLWPKDLDWGAYNYVFTHPLLASSYKNTVIVTAVAVVLSLFITVITAYPLSKPDFRGKTIIINLLIFTMLFNGGLIPNYYLIRSMGLIDSLWALILPGLLGAFNVILMKNFMESIPQSLEEAAKMDGASELYVLFKIVLPLSTPILATLGLFTAVGHWNSFFNAVIYIRDNHKWTLQLLLREIIMSASLVDNQLEAQKYVMPETIKYASLIVVMLPIMCIYPFLQKYFVKGIMIGAVKG